MLLYYITDRSQFPGDETRRCTLLLDKIAEAARCAVNYIQLREKDLTVRELEALARQAMEAIRENGPKTGLLINARADVALATGAAGVHLRSNDISPSEVRKAWKWNAESRAGAGSIGHPIIAVSCHRSAEVAGAAREQADFAVFAPVFGKQVAPGSSPAGIEALGQACRQNIPVLALGGVTVQNAQACMDAGAAGIAAIRLFQENEIAKVVENLRG